MPKFSVTSDRVVFNPWQLNTTGKSNAYRIAVFVCNSVILKLDYQIHEMYVTTGVNNSNGRPAAGCRHLANINA